MSISRWRSDIFKFGFENTFKDEQEHNPNKEESNYHEKTSEKVSNDGEHHVPLSPTGDFENDSNPILKRRGL